MPSAVPSRGPALGKRDQGIFVERVKGVFLLTVNLEMNNVVLVIIHGCQCQMCDH